MNESELIDQIYGTVADPSRWSSLIIRIADYLGAAGGLLSYTAPDGRTLVVLGRLSEEHSKIYRQHYVWNPWTLAMMGFPTGQAVIANSLLEPGALFKTGFYADVLAPQGLVNSLHTILKR